MSALLLDPVEGLLFSFKRSSVPFSLLLTAGPNDERL